jgi:hypothetical protein
VIIQQQETPEGSAERKVRYDPQIYTNEDNHQESLEEGYSTQLAEGVSQVMREGSQGSRESAEGESTERQMARPDSTVLQYDDETDP